MSIVELRTDGRRPPRLFNAFLDGQYVGSARWLRPGRWSYEVEGRTPKFAGRRRAARRGLIRACGRLVRDRQLLNPMRQALRSGNPAKRRAVRELAGTP